ncbi:hypothetical protein [Fluviicola sp.]|uniref:hypothetical protein n=1 Tax=Fluviicola sp. TaxID=1917219 RepID=UPI0031D7691D
MTQESNAKPAAVVMIVFLFLAIAGFIGCVAFGVQTQSYYVRETSIGGSYEVIADSGLKGGAIGCGIFGAAALWGFVKVFLTRAN